MQLTAQLILIGLSDMFTEEYVMIPSLQHSWAGCLSPAEPVLSAVVWQK